MSHDNPPWSLPAALDEFNRELMRTQYMIGVLAALGEDVSEFAASVSRIARRGSELLCPLTTTEHRQ